MPYININRHQLKKFELIVESYKSFTKVPERGKWKAFSNDELWIRHVGQIIVVGGSAGKDRFDFNDSFRESISFDALSDLSEGERLFKVNRILRKAAVRYASDDISKCKKSHAVCHNYQFLIKFDNHFTGLMRYLFSIRGFDAEVKRVNYLRENMQFMKNKSARDFLMGSGMNRNTLALDVRIRNIFINMKIDFPEPGKLSKPQLYYEVEQKIKEKICNSLNVEPIVFDRILYQNYKKILAHEYLMPKLF